MNNFQKLYDEITDMLYWAEEQRHINIEQRDLLLDNVIKAKERIEKETQ